MDETNLQGETPAEAAEALPLAESAPAAVEPSETPEPEKKDRLQERFDKLTREKYDALRERDRLSWEVEELRRQFQAQAKPPQVAPEQPLTLEQFGYDEARYNAAVVAQAARIAEQKAAEIAEQKFREREQQQTQQQRQQSWQQREADFAKATPDYRDVAYDPSVPISREMAEVIAESSVGPAIAYYLGKNRDEAAQIAGMGPLAAARALGRIEARLESKPVSQPVSKAPPPPPKVEASEEPVEKDPEQMSVAEWLKWREKQLKRRKG